MSTAALLAWAPAALWAQDPELPPDVAAQYHVLVGELAALRQMPEIAAEEFLKALQIVPDPELAMRAASMALAARNEALAYDAARRWQALAPDEADAREAVARLALRAGDRVEAAAQCEAIIKGHPGGPEEGFRQVAQVLSQDGAHRDDALVIMDGLRRKYATLPGAWYAQSLLALRFNDLNLAEQSAREALRLKPDARDPQLLLTGVLVKRGDVTGADRIIAGLVKGAPNAHDLRMGYARLLLEADRQNEARRQFEIILAEKPDATEARYALGLLALEQLDFDGAEPHFRALLQTEDLRTRAAYYLGRIEETRKRYPEALALYAQVNDGEQAVDALVRRALTLGKMGQVDEARQLLSEMRRQMPMLGTRFYVAESELLMGLQKHPDALALLDQALRETPDDPDLLYARSLIHEQLKNVRQAEADLRRILVKQRDDARAMNALGYMLTVHTDRLEEARQLISRALELSPEDAAVIDSMGWVEYRQGKMQEARVLLERAFDKAKDPEIAAHLGEVLWVLGEKERARAIWEAALTRDPDHRMLRETMTRLAH